MVRRSLIVALAVCGCHGKSHEEAATKRGSGSDPGSNSGSGAGSNAGSASSAGTAGSNAGSDAAWPELASIPKVEPVRVIPLPVRSGEPRFDLGGPVVLGDVAVVASSQFGFLAVDYHAGHVAWTKPAGSRVAPPVVVGGSVVLVGECLNAQPVADTLLGCVRIVTATGADQGYLAIHGSNLDAFANEPGEQETWASGDHSIVWRRGDAAVTVDLLTGKAMLATDKAPPVVVHYKGKTWTITQDDDGIIHGAGATKWQTSRPYTQLIGAVLLPEQGPMIRASNAGAYSGQPELNLFDIDATGSLHGQVAFPVPGIGLIGHAINSIGDTALAVRLDKSLERDFIAGYAANALLMWVYPLPRQPRPDPVGLAVAPDAVVVFHDGDTLTILPELSAPPTAPGAAKPPSENPTP